MIIVPHSTPHASTRSRALTDALKVTIAEFRKRDPKLTDADIEAALAAARTSSHAMDAKHRRALLGVLAGVAVVAGSVIVLMAQATPASNSRVQALVIAGAAVVVAVVGLVIRLRNNP